MSYWLACHVAADLSCLAGKHGCSGDSGKSQVAAHTKRAFFSRMLRASPFSSSAFFLFACVHCKRLIS